MTLEFHKKLKGKIEVISRTKIATKEDLSLAYTPGVAQACKAIVEDPSLVWKLTRKQNLVAVITDGTAVLGLGDIGPEASIPVMEGKAILMKEFADVDGFPIALDTKDTEEIIETVKRIAPMFGAINLEDISAPRCFEIEERLQKELPIPVFHDDQHGTAIVVLAGLYNALQVVGKRIEDIRMVVNGVGAAGVAITKLLLLAGVQHIVLVDSKGLIFAGRDNLNHVKEALANSTNLEKRSGGLAEALAGADVFVGVSQPNLVSEEMVRSMAGDQIIFAMANPDPEIMPEDARAGGAAVIATGRSDFPNQINNVLAFPGIFRGLLDARIPNVTEGMKLAAARALADFVQSPTAEKIIPDPFEKGIADAVAEAVKGCA
ncbi:MAG: NAD-dependent malic enzyme [Candidatus Magasanikbacteria bacterium CG11_big_fil_rev_8_21_14_0_20_43_7]|uniref:NAD-dependent malic enzyme n=1 Tax=Candidatus Magasanikbacteria bacterium CG11_big_fil_rev_8_21_14_0_20_43_7 TaxID=1974654 RepID=A0A2H0N323_9BACT|nr:MAG: NAD-dependent malic enzyme [Candidatus Magasanikbacteria bacterium CG11_big_fil_rev_8_21_14_0_20_43_7]